jgi:Lysophospholipase
MRKYANERRWRKIQSFLPKQNRITGTTAPSEECLRLGTTLLHIDHYKSQSPKGVVVIFHGVGGNGRLLAFIAVPLWKAGYEVVCPDLPMYGLTEYKGKVTYSDWIDCGTKVCRRYRKQGIPLFVFGLSAGGLLAYQVACRLDKVDGMIATCLLDQRNPTVTMNTASNRITAVVGKPFLRIVHGLFGSVKIPMKMVCNMQAIVNDERVARLLISDPLSSGAKVTLAFIHGMLNPDICPEAKDFRKCPVLLVHPKKDNWTDVSLSKLFFDDIPERKELVMLQGAGHFPIEPFGLSVLENECRRFMDNIVRIDGMK